MPINVVSVSMTYPSADRPRSGIFVRRRLEALARRMNVRVIAPRPKAILWRSRPRGPLPCGADAQAHAATAGDESACRQLPTRRPALFYVPGVLKWSDPWFYARVLERELQAIRGEFRPDLIDAQFEWPDGVAVGKAARRLGLPYAVTVRGKIVSHARYAARRRQMRDMLRGAALRIAVSRDLAQRAAALADDGRPVHVVPNGIDAEIFRPTSRAAARAALGLDPAARYLVSVGFVQELKGFDRLVAVLPRVRARCGDVRLLLVGEEAGEHAYSRALDRAIEQGGLRGAVQRVGGAAAERVAQFLNAADLFVLSTRSEGWCNAIHESLACGTPVIATDVGGNRELVRTADDGVLVPFGDAAALADAMTAGLSRDWQRGAIAAKAAARTWDDVACEVQELFLAALKPPRRKQAQAETECSGVGRPQSANRNSAEVGSALGG